MSRPRLTSLARAQAALASARRRGRSTRTEEAPDGAAAAVDESGIQEVRESLRERILRVATALFAERGYQGASLREVAAAAGCTKPALYYHYRSKDGLFLAALEEEATQLTELLDEGLRHEGSVRDRLVAALAAFASHCRVNPAGLALLERAEGLPDEGQPSFDFGSIRSVHLGLARRLLEDGVEAGELRADLPIEEAVLALAGVVHQRSERFLRDGEPIPVDFPERAVDLLMRGFVDGVGSASPGTASPERAQEPSDHDP